LGYNELLRDLGAWSGEDAKCSGGSLLFALGCRLLRGYLERVALAAASAWTAGLLLAGIELCFDIIKELLVNFLLALYDLSICVLFFFFFASDVPLNTDRHLGHVLVELLDEPVDLVLVICEAHLGPWDEEIWSNSGSSSAANALLCGFRLEIAVLSSSSRNCNGQRLRQSRCKSAMGLLSAELLWLWWLQKVQGSQIAAGTVSRLPEIGL